MMKIYKTIIRAFAAATIALCTLLSLVSCNGGDGSTAVDKSRNESREDSSAKAENGIKARLVLEAIARTEDLQVTDQDIEERIQLMADQFKTTPEDIKEKLGPDHKEALTADLRMVKAVAFIKENAEITPQDNSKLN